MSSLLRLFAIAVCVIILPTKTIGSEDVSLECKFTLDNGTDFKDLVDIEFGINLDEIMDTELPGRQLLSVQAKNVKAIKTVTSNSINNNLYMMPILEADRLLLKLTYHFIVYEENEIIAEMSIKVTFECLGGSTAEVEFIQPIKDTNNHYPEFINVPYIYTLPMPLPKNIQLNHFQVISARDADLTNSNISFCLDPSDPNSSAFSVSWMSRDVTDRKRFYATLVTKAVVNFVEDVTFHLYATDGGNPPKTSVISVTIKVDHDSSILRFERPLYTADLTNLIPNDANGKIITFDEGEIFLGGGVDKTVNFTINGVPNDYAKNFQLVVADDHSKIRLRLVDPPEKFFLENFIVLSLKAKKVGSEETTVLHITLPGGNNIILEPPTTQPTDNWDSDCKFTYENNTAIPDITFGVYLDPIPDTTPVGTQLVTILAKNVQSITSITSNSQVKEVYVKPILDGERLTLELEQNFAEYEENEINEVMGTTITFKCLGGLTTKVEFLQTIEDTNNHFPEFIDEPYIYTLPMPFPKNIQLNHFQAISARDIDIGNANISFTLDSDDPNVSAFSVSWLSRDTTDRKRYHATLVTNDVINFVTDVTFILTATDSGNPTKSSTTNVTIIPDRANSIVHFEKPLYIADLTNLTPEEADGKEIPFGKISLSGGADENVIFTITDDFSGYEKNFKLTVAEDHASVSLSLVDPPATFFLQSFVVLILTAKKSASEEKTVLHISLPGRANVPEPSSTPPTTDPSGNDGKECTSEQEECDNVDYVVAIIILAILLLVTTVGLLVLVFMHCRIRKRSQHNMERVTNGGHEISTEMGEIRNSRISPNPSIGRSVAFDDNVEEMKIERL